MMKLVIYWLPTVFLLSFCQTEELARIDNCKCVSYFLCLNGTISQDGTDVLDIRPRDRVQSIIHLYPESLSQKECDNILEVCCALPKENSNKGDTVVPIAKSSVERKKCITQPRHQNVGSDTIGANTNGIFPWTVAIGKVDTNDKSNFTYRCGGTLIHPQIVLTAAHCVNDENPSFLQVHAGQWLPSNNHLYQDRQVQDIIIHEKFDVYNLHYDFGLLILNKPVDLIDENVNIVYLAETNENFDRSRCIANGWGKKNLTEENKAVLKRIELPMVPHKQCQTTFRRTFRLGEYFTLHNSFICAGGEFGKDTCEHDGGRPLVCPMKDIPDKYVLVGIVAWGIVSSNKDCGEEDLPSVYANVAYARNWIDEKVTQAGYNLGEYQCIP